MSEKTTVNGTEYTVLKLLGHGKGGYSYLREKDGQKYVLKRIHHEPCSYYQFADKMESEIRDYQLLKEAGIRIPEMLEADYGSEIIVKQFISGRTIFDMVRNHESTDEYLDQVRTMACQAAEKGLNIDYFPTNFVVNDGLLYYVDYECNDYMEEWNFENWGIKYWSYTPEFREYLMGQNIWHIVSLLDHPEMLDKAVKWFHEKWGVPEEAYRESMLECLNGEGVVPQWYMAVYNDEIIGGLGVIENDFHDRKDLAPNVCAVYVEKQWRGIGVAGKLLKYCCIDMKEKGIDTLYLLTDHDSFYERYGWQFYCNALGDGEHHLSRLYIHKQ